MSLALQALALGIYTHGMAGIDVDAAHERLGVDTELWTVMCAFAAGRIGPPEALPPELRDRERPKDDRKALGEIAHRGILGGADRAALGGR